MSVINLKGFAGEQPRIIPRLMSDQAAQSAINSRLDDGGLTPMRESVLISALTGVTDPRSIYLFGATWLAWDTPVNAAPGPVADDRLYYTGDGVPKMRVGSTVYPLAVPFPAGALTATPTGTGSGDVVTRVYAYTWVTDFGEESEPSPASNAVQWQPGQSVTLSGFAATPAGRNITKQRIFRTQTGSFGTTLYLIAERAAATVDFTDNIAPEAFSEPLPSTDWTAPPAGLQGLITLPNGMMAGFVGRDIYFCEPWHPHAWPEKYVLTSAFEVVGLGAVGNAIVVMTKGSPYLINGTTPDSMSMQLIEQNFPCINARGIVDLGYVIAYPSHEGLITVAADGTFNVATAPIFKREDWLELNPATMVGCQISGRYVAFYSAVASDGALLSGCLMISLGGQFLIRSATAARAAYFDLNSGGLYYVPSGALDVYRFDAPNAKRLNQFWKSKQFVLPNPDNFGAIRVDSMDALNGTELADLEASIAAIKAENAALVAAGPVGGELNGSPLNIHTVDGDKLTPIPALNAEAISVGVIADGEVVATVTKSNRPVRLPAGFTARTWEITVFGNTRIEQIVMAKTIDELKSVL